MQDTDGYSLPSVEYPYAVQRFNEAAKSWQTVMDETEKGWCAFPQTDRIGPAETYLSPGSSVKVMGSEATGAREPFRKGDLARFVVFRNVGARGDWKLLLYPRHFASKRRCTRGEHFVSREALNSGAPNLRMHRSRKLRGTVMRNVRRPTGKSRLCL